MPEKEGNKDNMPGLPQLGTDAPWKARFRVTQIGGAQIALQNPQRGLLVSNRSGVNQLYRWDVPANKIEQLTDKAEGIEEGFLAPDGSYVYYLNDLDGDEIGHYVRQPWAGGPQEDMTPALSPYYPLGCYFSQTGERLAFIAINGDTFIAYTIDIAPDGTPGTPRPFLTRTSRMRGPLLVAHGELAIIEDTSETHSLNYALQALDSQTGQLIAQLMINPESSLEAWLVSSLPNDARIIALSNHTGRDHPVLWNPLTNETHHLAPELEGDVHPMDWSRDGRALLLRQTYQARQRLFLYHLSDHTLSALSCPDGTLGTTEPRSIFFQENGDIVLNWENSAHPKQVLLLTPGARPETRVLLADERLPAGHNWQSVIFPSTDGVPIQAWLGKPRGSGPFPTIIELHGGPEYLQSDVFSPGSQSWLDHGFAYMTVNYRGSTGFGAAFQEKIRGQPGYWELEDIVSARNWLIQQEIARPEHIFLSGWSYGGYLTLYALGRRPDLWAGGMAGIALADFGIADEEESTIRSYLRLLLGGSLAEKPQRYHESSALTYVSSVQAPVLIIQGRKDSRAPARAVEVYEERMKALHKSIEVYWFEAGHGSSNMEEIIHWQELLLQFVYRHLPDLGNRHP